MFSFTRQGTFCRLPRFRRYLPTPDGCTTCLDGKAQKPFSLRCRVRVLASLEVRLSLELPQGPLPGTAAGALFLQLSSEVDIC